MKNADQVVNLFCRLPFAVRAMLITTFLYPWLAYVIGASFLSGIYLPQAFNFFGYYKAGDIIRAGIIPMFPIIMLFVLMIFFGSIAKLQPLILKFAGILIKNWLRCLIVYSFLICIIARCIMGDIASSSSCASTDQNENFGVLGLSSSEIGLPPATDWLFSYRQNAGIIIAKRAENFDTRYFPSRLSDNEAYACFTNHDWLVRLLF